MNKPIHSLDCRKPMIVAALKTASGGNKITNVRQVSPVAFAGDAMVYDRGGYTRLGAFMVEIAPDRFPLPDRS